MDPYCTVKSGDTESRTCVQQDVGRNPVWDEQFVISETSQLELAVYDSQPITDRMVGNCRVKLADFKEGEVAECGLTLKNESSGKVYFKHELISSYIVLTGMEIAAPRLKITKIKINQSSYQIEMPLPKKIERTLVAIPILEDKIQISID